MKVNTSLDALSNLNYYFRENYLSQMNLRPITRRLMCSIFENILRLVDHIWHPDEVSFETHARSFSVWYTFTTLFGTNENLSSKY